jgi:hypothetical protein
MLTTTVSIRRCAAGPDTRYDSHPQVTSSRRCVPKVAIKLDSIPVDAGFHGGQVCEVYNQGAFWHFLAVERSRAYRSQRCLYLVLVAIRKSRGRSATLTNTTSAALFRGLAVSVREVDFVGWYRAGHIAAAVLLQGVKVSDGGVKPIIADRVRGELRKGLTATELKNLRVRVVRLGGTTKVRFP